MRFDFLLCSERSGSNLVTRILNAHPQVCGPAPKNLMETFSMNLFRYGDLGRDESWSCLCGDMADLLNNAHGLWRSRFSAEELRGAVKSRSVSELYRYAFEREARANGKSRVFVKNNHLYRYAAPLLGYFADAKLVYVVRDPRDMALEWERTPLMPGGIVAGASTWKEDQEASIRLYAQLKDLGRIILVRFEDLLEDPEPVLRGVCSFLDLDYTERMLEFHTSEDVIANAKRVGVWKEVAQPLIRTNHGFYRSGLGEREIRYVESLCREEMDWLGYRRDYADPGDLAALKEEMSRRSVPSVVRTESEQAVYAAFFAAVDRVRKRKLY